MPRNASGTYSLPAGNPVVTGTTVASSWANTTLDDLKAEVTDSLDRSGKGGMLAPLALLDGAVGAPSLTFAGELSTGLYRPAAGQFAAAVSGAQRLLLSTTAPAAKLTSPLAAADAGSDLLLDTAVARTAGNILAVQNFGAARLRLSFGGTLVLGGSGTIQSTDTTNLGLVLMGNKSAADAGADVVLTGAATRTAGSLLDVQNNGVSQLRVGFGGALYQVPANTSLTLNGNRSAADAGADLVVNTQVARTAGLLLDVQNNAVSQLQVRYNGALDLLAAGTLLTSGANLTLLLQGNRSAADAGTDLVLQSTATRTAGRLLEVKNNGVAALYVSAVAAEAVALNTWHRQRVSADFSTTSNILQNVTGMSFAATANADYEFLAVLRVVRASAATGLQVAFSGPAAPTNLHFTLEQVTSGSLGFANVTAFGTTVGVVDGTTTLTYICLLRGIFRNGANAGTVQLQLRSTDNATSVTIAQGSTMDWRRTDALE